MTTAWTGSGYVSGLYLAGRLILDYDLTAADLSSELAVRREPQDELLAFVLHRNNTQRGLALSDRAFRYCLGRQEWAELLAQTIAQTEGTSELTDDQIEALADCAETPGQLLLFTRSLQDRGQIEVARDLLTAHLDGRVGTAETAEVLEHAHEIDLLDQISDRLRASLNRWRPEDDVAELERLATLGCEHAEYDAVVRATRRWLRATEGNISGPHRVLVAYGIKALIRRQGPGEVDAIHLYREYLYPADSLYGLGDELYRAAEALDATDVIDDIHQVYDSESSEKVTDSKLAARVAEDNGEWDRAFRIWEEILEADGSREVLESAIENRLAVSSLADAEQLVERFESEGYRQYANAYKIRIAAIRGNARKAVDIAQRDDSVFTLDSLIRTQITEDYVQCLAELRRWDTIESFLHDSTELDSRVHRFYRRLSTLMRFIGEDSSSLVGDEAVDLLERLLTSPLDTDELQLLLNLDVVGQIDNRLRSSYPNAYDRMDVIRGLTEILVTLHAERLIDALSGAGVNTAEFEQRLAETGLGRGGRQLLSELSREARRAGVTTKHGRN
jgi:tetratricopeptide (TPR) repeat protein